MVRYTLKILLHNETRFLKCVRPFWHIVHWMVRVQFLSKTKIIILKTKEVNNYFRQSKDWVQLETNRWETKTNFNKETTICWYSEAYLGPSDIYVW